MRAVLTLALLPLLAVPVAVDAQAGSVPAKGRFLVAARSLLDPNFHETVVLLLDYSRMGAMGLVINRPTEFKITEALPELEQLAGSQDPVLLGGPVQVQQVTVLVRADVQPDGGHQIFEDVWALTSETAIDQMLPEDGRYRIFAGYAGWAAGQLDAELERGGWHVVDADAELVFDTPLRDIWPKMIRRGTAPLVRLGGAQPHVASRQSPVASPSFPTR